MSSPPPEPKFFTPPYPTPHKSKSSFLLRFFRGWHSWLHVLFERSYRMKMGELRQPGFKVYMVNEPKLVRKVMVDEYKKFPKHDLMHRLLLPLLGNSIFTTNGPVWERQRRLMDQAFQQARLQLVFPLMKDSVDGMLARMDKVADGRSYEVDAEMTYITADIIFRTILSEDLGEDDAQKIYESFIAFQEQAQQAVMLMMYRLPSFFPRKASEKSARIIRSLIADLISRRYEAAKRGDKPKNQDILAALMEAVDPVEGNQFTYDEMVDQICMLFLAGHETSASALAWGLYLISNCPHIQVRMREEVRSEVGERDFEYGDAQKLKFTMSVFRETLRLYPPVGFFIREATETQCMRDKTVEKGSPVLISPWLMQRHRDLWDHPDQFDPDRFGTPEGKESAKCAYLPFSMGPRVCIGQAFATQEAVLVLASIVRRYDIEPVPEHVPETVGRVTIRSNNGIRIRLKKRNGSRQQPT